MSKSQRPKILLLIPHLGGGGAEHVIAMLGRLLDRDKYDVHLGLVTQASCDDRHLSPWITVHRLNARRVRNSALKLLQLVWRVRPALILSGIAHLNLLVLWLRPLFPPCVHILIRQNGSSSAMLASLSRPSLSRFLYRVAYRQADGIICQTRSMAGEISRDLCIELPQTIVLPNPLDIGSIRSAAEGAVSPWKTTGPNLLAVGRLVPEKGFDLLIAAFAAVHSRFPDAELVIAGRGVCESTLRIQRRNLNLEDHARIVGHIPSPAAYFRGASLFALPSRDEGMPNALLEAAAAGLPIAALPASRGVAELLQEKPGVWLGSHVSVNELERILCEALTSITPGQRFNHAWVEPFEAKTAIRAYENLIDRLLQECLR